VAEPIRSCLIDRAGHGSRSQQLADDVNRSPDLLVGLPVLGQRLLVESEIGDVRGGLSVAVGGGVGSERIAANP
jgi:hypothetical protein